MPSVPFGQGGQTSDDTSQGRRESKMSRATSQRTRLRRSGALETCRANVLRVRPLDREVVNCKRTRQCATPSRLGAGFQLGPARQMNSGEIFTDCTKLLAYQGIDFATKNPWFLLFRSGQSRRAPQTQPREMYRFPATQTWSRIHATRPTRHARGCPLDTRCETAYHRLMCLRCSQNARPRPVRRLFTAWSRS